MELRDLQAKVKAWSQRNFPNVPLDGLHALLGAVEEWGEYREAFRSPLPIETVKSELEDAIADMTVYLLDHAWRIGLIVPTNAEISAPATNVPEMYILLGKMSHCAIKKQANIRGNEALILESSNALALILRTLKDCYDAFMEGDYFNSVAKVWEEVEKRDWIAYPDTGFPSKEAKRDG